MNSKTQNQVTEREWNSGVGKAHMLSIGHCMGNTRAEFTHKEDAIRFCREYGWHGVMPFFGKYNACANLLAAQALTIDGIVSNAGYIPNVVSL